MALVSSQGEKIQTIADINSNTISISSSGVSETTGTTTLLSKTGISNGTYLVYGSIPLNYYGQEGRELKLQLKVNGNVVWNISNVINTYAWSFYTQICTVITLKSSDTLSLVLSDTANKPYSCTDFVLNLFRLK